MPDNLYFRIHHVRPRFKNNVENVLIFLSEEITNISQSSCSDFRAKLNSAIRRFPGNINVADKTINNWRTEISALFGFYIENKKTNTTVASQRAIDLATNQDLIQFFKIFLYFFQYPGGHIKPHEVKRCIEKRVKFKPAVKIIEVLMSLKELSGKSEGISKAEATHVIFNDLRVTSGIEEPIDTAKRLLSLRKRNTEYDWAGDVIRYAGDILDYMSLANILNYYNGYFYLNSLEQKTCNFFLNNTIWFDKYDTITLERESVLQELNEIQIEWFKYINQVVDDDFFITDILALVADNEQQYQNFQNSYDELLKKADTNNLRTKEIGDLGESLAYGHECKRITDEGRPDLVHLIKLIPTALAAGYDLQSVEINEKKRYIEVKTTISNKNIAFHRFHLTPNEWNSAKTLSDRYFVYRLYISKKDKKLYVLQNPERLYKEDKIEMTINSHMGIEIVFKPEISGEYQELLTWS